MLPRTALVLLLLCGGAFAAPMFDNPTQVYAGGSVIDVGYYAAPCVADWNGDGLKDLILGEFSLGKIRYYGNEDSNDSPVFSGYSYLQADGVDITLPYG